MDDRQESYRRAAADLLELAKNASDENARAGWLSMAQKFLELATSASMRTFNAVLTVFNDSQLHDK
jgi:hypothetical protein